MAIASSGPKSRLITYETYMAEPFEGSYDIIDGVLITMPGATWEHQEIVGNIYDGLRDYGRASGNGRVLMAPFDVLIRRVPRLRTRQPDVFFISNTQLAQGGGIPQRGPLEIAPELVIEVISDSETQRRVEAKIQDYLSIGVQECWKVWPETRTVEVLRLTSGVPQVVATYGETQTVCSLVFPDLTLPVADIFAA